MPPYPSHDEEMAMEEYDDTTAIAEQGAPGQYIPPTLSESHLKFLDGNDEVPAGLRNPLWGLFTRHNQLTNIKSEWDMHRIRTQVRCVTRIMLWNEEITIQEAIMIQRFVELQIQKSFNQGERRLLAPWLQQITKVEEYAERPRNSGGALSKGVGFIFGRR